MSTPPRVRLLADYDCHPVWERRDDGGLDNLDPGTLDLPVVLTDGLAGWAAVFDGALNRSDPIASGFATDLEAHLFAAWGRALAGWLGDELGEPVEYFDVVAAKVHLLEPSG